MNSTWFRRGALAALCALAIGAAWGCGDDDEQAAGGPPAEQAAAPAESAGGSSSTGGESGAGGSLAGVFLVPDAGAVVAVPDVQKVCAYGHPHVLGKLVSAVCGVNKLELTKVKEFRRLIYVMKRCEGTVDTSVMGVRLVADRPLEEAVLPENRFESGEHNGVAYAFARMPAGGASSWA